MSDPFLLETLTPTPHDALVKGVFTDPAQAVLLLRLLRRPDLVELLDLTTLRPAAGEFVAPGLHRSACDLLFEVSLAGSDLTLSVVIEHQSQVERDVPYCAAAFAERLADRHCRQGGSRLELPPTLIVVVFQGPGPWTGPTRLGELIQLSDPARALLGPFQRELVIPVVELGSLSLSDLAGLDGPPLGRLALMLLRASHDEVELRRAWSEVGIELLAAACEASPAGYGLLVSYTWNVSCSEDFMAKLQDDVLGAQGPAPAAPFVSALEQLSTRLRAEGRAEGRAEEARRLLVLQLTEKFGAPGETTLARLSAASPEQLERWARAILSATSVEQLLGR